MDPLQTEYLLYSGGTDRVRGRAPGCTAEEGVQVIRVEICLTRGEDLEAWGEAAGNIEDSGA